MDKINRKLYYQKVKDIIPEEMQDRMRNQVEPLVWLRQCLDKLDEIVEWINKQKK